MSTRSENSKRTQTGFMAKNLLVSSMLVLLTACGSGGGGAGDAADADQSQVELGGAGGVANEASNQETVVSGNAIKGVISQGIVNVYLVEEEAGKMVRSSSALAEPVRTDENGYYEFVLDKDFSWHTLVVELTVDSLTRMKCDSTEGCYDNGETVAFGESFSPGLDFNLGSVVSTVDANEPLSVHLSPLTHMVLAHAESKFDGLTLANVADSTMHIEQLLDLDSGTLGLAPIDLTLVESYESLSKAELELGVLSASFLSLANDSRWNSVGEVIEHVESALKNEGVLGPQGVSGDDTVTLDEVFLEASEIASDLSQALPDSKHRAVFNEVNQETIQSYNVVAQVEEQPVLEIVSQPQSITVKEGEEILLAVGASGGELSFQWRKNGEFIVGAQSSSLLISNSSIEDTASYDVVVSDSSGMLESLAALVIVEAIEVEVPVEPEAPEEPPVTEPETPVQPPVTEPENPEQPAETEPEQPAETEPEAPEEPAVIEPESPELPPALDPVNIQKQPVSVTANEGESAQLSVFANGGGTLQYQWYKDGQVLSGESSSVLSFAQLSIGDSAKYSVTVSNSDSSVSSVDAILTVNEVEVIEPVVIISQPEGVEITEGETAVLSVVATGGGDLVYQWYKDGSVLASEKSSVLTLASASLLDAASYSVTVSNSEEVLVSESARVEVLELVEELAPIVITSQPSDVAVDEGAELELVVLATGGGDLAYQWFKNNVAILGQTTSTLTLNNVSQLDSGDYTVFISNADEELLSEVATVQVNEVVETVAIVAHPLGVTVDEGAVVELAVTATGGDELSYQWYKDGAEIVGEVSSILSIAEASLGDAGSYTVQVSNSVGLQMSSVASVQVNEVEVLYSVSLEWTIPEQREDGSALELNEIDNYLIRYGTSSSNLDQSVLVDSASDTSYLIEELSSGTYYFVISTIDIDGTESSESEVISINI